MKFFRNLAPTAALISAFALVALPSCSKNEGAVSPKDASGKNSTVDAKGAMGNEVGQPTKNDAAALSSVDAGVAMDLGAQKTDTTTNASSEDAGTPRDASTVPDAHNITGQDTGNIISKLDASNETATPTNNDTGASTDTGTAITVKPGEAINHKVEPVGFGSGTTGGGGAKKTVSSFSALQGAIGSNVTILVDGTISGSGMVEIKDQSNISIIGVGSNGKFRGVGLTFIRTKNIIVQNLSFENSSDDSINVEDANNVWIDHNTMSTDVNYLDCEKGSIKDKYDGQIDIKKNTKNVTVSFNYIHDACKAMLLGFSDGKEPDDLVTYHHNRFENVGSRLPLIRSADTHVYNNYYKNVLMTGINVRMGANALIENNFFENVDDPILSADSSAIGYWNVSGNIYLPNGPSYTHLVEKADVIGTVVNGEVKSTSTWRVSYKYTLDKTEDVPATVTKYAGAGKI